MKVLVNQKNETNVVTVRVSAGVRYFEDAELNGKDIENDSDFPDRVGNLWCPVIDIDTGVILGWPENTIASIHFKVCDNFQYDIVNEDGKVIHAAVGYVPRFMCPEDNGYGDYIIMKIDEKGRINKWNKDLVAEEVEQQNDCGD